MISMFVCRDGTVAAGEFCVRQPLAAPAQKGDATPRAPAPPKTEVRKHRRCGITAGSAQPFFPCVTFTSWRGGQQKSRQQRHPGLASHHPCCFRRQIVCGRLNIPDKGYFLLVIFEEFSFQFCTNVGRVSTNSTNRIFGLARGQARGQASLAQHDGLFGERDLHMMWPSCGDHRLGAARRSRKGGVRRSWRSSAGRPTPGGAHRTPLSGRTPPAGCSRTLPRAP